MTRIVAVGDNVIDHYLDLGLGFPGGNAVNVAVAAARAGCEAAYIGQVGDDAAGRRIRDALIAESVDVTRLRTIAGSTAVCKIGLFDGERHFLSSNRGVAHFEPDADDLAFLDGADLVHTSCYSGLDAKVPLLATRASVSYDFSETDPWAVPGLLSSVGVALFSGSELSWDGAVQLTEKVAEAGPKTVLVTRGTQTACLRTDGETFVGRPSAVKDVVDTLGAGDAYIGRLLVGLVGREPVVELLRAAARCAADAVTQLGGFGHGFPDSELR